MPHATTQPAIQLRTFLTADAQATLAVFLDAITVTAAVDYSPEQIAAWARPQERELSAWAQAMVNRNSVVALVDNEIAGFSDVDDSGFIDMMFVSPQYSRKGVASALLKHNELAARERGAIALTANVSITARPFFASRGFSADAEQHLLIHGIRMTNYRMSKQLDSA